MLKDIVVNLSPANIVDGAGAYAVSAASVFKAHLSGVAFVYAPEVPGTIVPGDFSANLIEAERLESEKNVRAATTSFSTRAKQTGISFETHEMTGSASDAAECFSNIARRFDLAIVGQSPPNGTMMQDLIVEAALFDSGRPIIVVPYIQKEPMTLGRVMVCWDGGRAAARAIADAMPLLRHANMVEILILAGERGKQDEVAGADMGQHLARHGLNVSISRVPLGDVDVADAILSHAADSGADFIVMGGYGHSRLREFILGGATRGLLQSMTVPVLMSH
jgi:nucleotide-binding universal stress UspA family protein